TRFSRDWSSDVCSSDLLIKTYLTPKKLRKKQYLLQEGDVCKNLAFVEKGALKSYTIDDNGNECIIQFAIEGWTIADLYSFLTGEIGRASCRERVYICGI